MNVCLVVDESRVSVLDLESDVVCHCSRQEHAVFREGHLATVEIEDLHRDALASALSLEVLVQYGEEFVALLLVFPFDINAHASFLIGCFSEELF